MTFPDKIDKLKLWLINTYDVRVEIDTSIEVSGRVHYSKKLILVNEPLAKDALLTILHEAGHYHSYILFNDMSPAPYRVVREALAMQYGYKIASALHIKHSTFDDEWEELHNNLHEGFRKKKNKGFNE